MAKKIENPLEIKEELLKDLNGTFGKNLLSVILFGSAATPRYVAGRSDINILLVVNDDAPEGMHPLAALEKKWEKRGGLFSFFLTPSYIESSLDANPLEFSEIKRDHILLFGQDYFSGLKIEAGLLRLQCERELKGKLLHLKREYVRHHHDRKALSALLERSFSQFLILFRGVLEVCGVNVAQQDSAALVTALGKALGLDAGLMETLAKGEAPRDEEGLRSLFVRYMALMEVVTNAVNDLKVPRGTHPEGEK